MSGPKVVRIVTREEIEAICRGHVIALEAACAELRRRAGRCGMLDAELERALDSRVAALKGLLARNEWMSVQKQSPEGVAFLRAEGDRMEAAAAGAAAAKRAAKRQSVDAARSVIMALEAAKVTVPDDLRAVADGRSRSQEDAGRHVAAAIALIPAGKNGITGVADVEMARRLAAGQQASTVSEYARSHAPAPNPAELRLDRLLSEIDILEDGTGDFARRADMIMAEADASRRALLTDSLVIDASAKAAALRGKKKAEARLREAIARLEAVQSEAATALGERIAAAIGDGVAASSPALEEQADALVEADAKAVAATARRQAVLEGLATLGYEIRQTMASAWERDGRIVVSKPGSRDYGVELGAPADVARLQVRLVGAANPSAPRDARRDADQETIWCSEFDGLRGSLARSGAELIIERALAPGEQPIRTAALPLSAGIEATVPLIRRQHLLS